MEVVATALVLLVLLALGGLVALPALPLLLRSRGRAGRLGRTIALCGASFFLTWCVVPIFVFVLLRTLLSFSCTEMGSRRGARTVAAQATRRRSVTKGTSVVADRTAAFDWSAG